MTSGSSFSRLARQQASQVAEMNASTIIAPKSENANAAENRNREQGPVSYARASSDKPNFIRAIETRFGATAQPIWSAAQEHIVDQTRIPDTNGQESHGRAVWPKVFQWIEGFRAGNLGIVEPGQRLGFYRFTKNLSNPAGLVLAGTAAALAFSRARKSTPAAFRSAGFR